MFSVVHYITIYYMQATPENEAVGMEHLLAAAKRNLKPAMFELAKALDTGLYTRYSHRIQLVITRIIV